MEIRRAEVSTDQFDLWDLDEDTHLLYIEMLRRKGTEEKPDETIAMNVDAIVNLSEKNARAMSIGPIEILGISEIRSTYIEDIKEIYETASPTEFADRIKHRAIIQKAAVRLIDLYMDTEV